MTVAKGQRRNYFTETAELLKRLDAIHLIHAHGLMAFLKRLAVRTNPNARTQVYRRLRDFLEATSPPGISGSRYEDSLPAEQ